MEQNTLTNPVFGSAGGGVGGGGVVRCGAVSGPFLMAGSQSKSRSTARLQYKKRRWQNIIVSNMNDCDPVQLLGSNLSHAEVPGCKNGWSVKIADALPT